MFSKCEKTVNPQTQEPGWTSSTVNNKNWSKPVTKRKTWKQPENKMTCIYRGTKIGIETDFSMQTMQERGATPLNY